MEYMGLIITIVGTGIGIIISLGALVLTLFLWNRGEGNSDRRDIVNLVIAIKEDIQAIQLEMKDFHNRLVDIERNKK
jgi:hypothetical protein